MADIRTIGIKFDPAPAKAGAETAKKAVADMAQSVGRDLKRVEGDGKKTGTVVKEAGAKIETSAKGAAVAVDKLGRGKGFQRMATDARGSLGQVSRGVIDMLDTFGLMDSGIGRMVRRVQSGISSVAALGAAMKAYQGAGAKAVEATVNIGAAMTETAEAAANLTSAGTEVVETTANLGSTATEGIEAITNLASAAAEAAEGAGDLGGAAGEAGGMLGGLRGMITDAAGGLTKFSIVALPIAGILAGIVVAAGVTAAGLYALSKAWDAVMASIGPAAKMESFEIKLAVSMGSFDEARKKMVGLKKFANDTPFSDAEVFGAGVKLQTMTEGALSTAEALKAIGGSAYQSGRSFEDMADLAGRTFQAIKLGMDFTEPLKTMNSYGMISGDTVKTVMALGAATSKSASEADKAATATKQWGLVFEDLKANSVALVLASKTWDGLMSTLAGNWEALKAAFGAPIIDGLKPILTQLIGMFPFLIEQAGKMGEVLANGIKFFYQTIKNGDLGKFLALALDYGITTGVANLATYFQAAFPEVSKMLSNALTVASAAAKLVFVEAAVAVIETTAKILLGALEMAFKAAVYVLSGGMIDTFTKSTGEFETTGKTATQSIADTLQNALSQSFSRASEDFMKFMEEKIKALSPLMRVFSFGIEKAAEAYTYATAAPAAPGPSVGGAMNGPITGPFVGVDELTAWIKDPTVTVENLPPDGSVLPPKPLSTDNQGGGKLEISGPPDPRGELEKMVASALSDFKRENPGFSNSDLGPKRPTNDPMSDPTGDLAGTGKGAADAAIPKAKPVELSELEKLSEEWGNLEKQIQQTAASAMQAISGGMTTALTSMIMGTKSAKQAFSEMAVSIVNDILQMILKMTIQLALQKALGGYASALNGVGAAHSGGTVGATNLSTTGSRTVLPTYHSGGMATSEQAVKVERGESILTRKRAKELEMELSAQRGDRSGQQRGGGSEATIINVFDRNEIADAVVARPEAVVNAISRQLPAVRKMVMSGQRL